MKLFRFAPGNGIEYRLLIGRAAAPPSIARFMPDGGYTVFGFAEGDDALITVVLDAPASFSSFARRWETARHVHLDSDPETLVEIAYAVYCSLVNLPWDYDPPGWVATWREIVIEAQHKAAPATEATNG
ncbi:MAG: hypothetical protein OHK0022_28070 [Roseiflexaceae bacterium]